MNGFEDGKILELYLAENDRLHDAILAKCRDLGISGVTVFRGLEGYGPTAEIHRRRMMGKDQPIVMVMVDRAEVIEKAIPVLGDLLGQGLMTVSNVKMKRVVKA